MSKKEQAKDIYIDALALVPDKKSGVGLTLEQTLRHLSIQVAKNRQGTIYLVVPLGKARYLKQYLSPAVESKTIPIPARLLELLLRLRLLPPLDWFVGEGVYVFPNYRNWPLWRSKNITYVYDTSFIVYPETVNLKNQRYLSRYIRRWVSRADKVVTISHQVEGEIEKYLHVPYTKLAVIYCGVDRKVFYKRSQIEIERAKQQYGISFDNYFIFVGNIEPRKNLEKLLDAYLELSDSTRKEHGLVLVGGDGWLNEGLYKRLEALQAAGENVLKVASYVENADLPALYSGATALVHPAIYEGFGLTPLEAMACETPVAVSNIPAIKEVVQAAGRYFDPENAKSISEAMADIIKNRQRMTRQQRQGLERAKEFSWNSAAQDLNKLIEDEFAAGLHRHPMVRRLKSVYVSFDLLVRRLLGEKELAPYRPAPSADKQELKKIIEADFRSEQPLMIQVILLSLYQAGKHAVAKPLKVIYRKARS